MIVQRYFIREFLHYFFAVFFSLVMVAAVFIFVELLAEMSTSVFSGVSIFHLLILKIIAKLSMLLPAALYVAILLALSRLSSDSEIVAMWAGGIGPRQINLIVFRFLLAFAAATSLISLYLSPEAFAAHEVVLARVREEAKVSMVLPGRFLELRNGELVAYAEALSADGREMQNVFARFTIAGSQNILVAKRAHFSGRKEEFGRYIVLEDGYRYSGSPGSVDYTVYRFAKLEIRIDQGPTGSVSKKPNSIPTWDLLKFAHPGYTAELQWRISQPISVLLLGMLAVPLARTLPRQGKHARLATGIAIYFLYENAAGIMQNFAERGQLSTLIGIWPVHLMMALVVGTLLYIQSTGRLPVLGKRNKSVQET